MNTLTNSTKRRSSRQDSRARHQLGDRQRERDQHQPQIPDQHCGKHHREHKDHARARIEPLDERITLFVAPGGKHRITGQP